MDRAGFDSFAHDGRVSFDDRAFLPDILEELGVW